MARSSLISASPARRPNRSGRRPEVGGRRRRRAPNRRPCRSRDRGLRLRREAHRRHPDRRSAPLGIESFEPARSAGSAPLRESPRQLAADLAMMGRRRGPVGLLRSVAAGLASVGALGAGPVSRRARPRSPVHWSQPVGSAGMLCRGNVLGDAATWTSTANTRAGTPAAMTAINDRPCMCIPPKSKRLIRLPLNRH